MSRESTKARRPARRRVFVAGPPLASLVDEAVAQLKIPPQRFGLPHRYIHSVTQLMALLHQPSHRLARRLGPATYCYWKHRAAGEMRPDTVGQVRVHPYVRVPNESIEATSRRWSLPPQRTHSATWWSRQ